MSQKNFLRYIHYFRGLAILFIVGLHVWYFFKPQSYFERTVTSVLLNNGTVLFVFIAGYLFFHLCKDNFDYGDYLKKKFLFVILPYLIVSIPALIDKFFIDNMGDHWWMDEAYAEKSVGGQVVYLLTTGKHMGIFWFIPMISILYIVAPLILRFARTQAFLIIAPCITILGLFTLRFGYYANIFLSLQYFVPVYLFGIWVYRIKDFLMARARMISIACISVFIILSILEAIEAIPFSELLALRDAQHTEYALNYNKLKMLILSVGVLLLFYLYNNRKIRVLQLLGDYSFGIFFIHLYIIRIFRQLYKAGILHPSTINFFSFILVFLGVVLLTALSVALIKLVLKDKSRYLIGS